MRKGGGRYYLSSRYIDKRRWHFFSDHVIRKGFLKKMFTDHVVRIASHGSLYDDHVFKKGSDEKI
jgi:hypothetical protein